jgi:hypothetical protein
MKKFLAAVLLLLPIFQAEAQPALWWDKTTINTNINGGPIVKGDTIEMEVKLNPNFSSIRSVFFDFQHQKDAITLLDVQKGAGIPANANFSYTNNYYPNCRFNRNQNNTTTNGWNNYANASYTCNSSTVPYHAINRIMVNVSSAVNLDHATYIKLRFRITNTVAGFPYDSVYMNFAFGYDANGGTISNTQNVGNKGVWISFSPTANNLIVGDVKHSANVSAGIKSVMRLSVTDTMPQPTEVTNMGVGGNGAFSFAQQLQNNTPYRFRLALPADSLAPLSLAATTISDYTMAVQEFITQNLDRTFKNENINKGIKYWAADVNMNGEFDGGDLQVLFNAVTGLDTILTPPAGCAQNCYYTLPTITRSVYDGLNFTDWKTLNTAYASLATTTAEQGLALNYVLRGDVNLSHSSPVTEQQAAMYMMGNLVVPDGRSIDTKLSNVVVTGDTITIPFNVDTKGISLSGLQYELKYDPTMVKFDKMFIDTPSWVSFVHPMPDGTIRFGALDKDLKNPLTGANLTPFKLRFVAVKAGVDLNTSVVMSQVMDAADNKGNQVGINLSSTVIRLVGISNFR